MLSSQIFKENFEVHSPINLDSAKIKAIHLHRDQSISSEVNLIKSNRKINTEIYKQNMKDDLAFPLS